MMKLIQIALLFLISNIVLVSSSSLRQDLNLSKSNKSEVATFRVGSFIFPKKNESLEFELKFFSPVKPGVYPVIFLLTGLNGFAPTLFYNEFCESLVEKTNSIVVSFDGLAAPKFPNKEELIFEMTLNWTVKNMIGLFASEKAPANIRDRVFPDYKLGLSLLSHSAAGHTVVSYLVKQCGLINSLILMDPVDGYDPFGVIKQFVTHPPKQLNFAIPTLIAATGLSSVQKSPKFPPCAPTNFSNVRFYDSLPGPTWFMNFTTYGHADILNTIVCRIFYFNFF
jgi:hypothetical protein